LVFVAVESPAFEIKIPNIGFKRLSKLFSSISELILLLIGRALHYKLFFVKALSK